MGQNPLSVEFLKTELETGITFAQLALSARREDKIERTKANARKAYDTAVKFMERLTPEKSAELDSLLQNLRTRLQDLGESV
jgi:Spy/CpxP family protein refolding chaperone